MVFTALWEGHIAPPFPSPGNVYMTDKCQQVATGQQLKGNPTDLRLCPLHLLEHQSPHLYSDRCLVYLRQVGVVSKSLISSYRYVQRSVC